MSRNPTGVLPSQLIKRLIAAGAIQDLPEHPEKGKDYINPASLDLPLSDEAYRLKTTLMPQEGETVESLLRTVPHWRYDLKNPLEVGVPYLIKIAGNYALPENVYGYINPKSSTGRINLLCRVIADKVDMYDALMPKGWSGNMWILVRPDSFPVLLTPGLAVSQLRLFDGMTFLDELELNMTIKEDGLFYYPNGSRVPTKKIRRHADSLLLSINVEDEVVGWECRGESEPLDYAKNNYYQLEDFFTPIQPKPSKSLVLRKGSFYILSTYEHVVVPPRLSAELRATDPRFGEFRSHAAGYIDPGWGWGKDGSHPGRPITLEVTPYEDVMVRHRQIVVRIRYEHMKEEPELSYDQLATSNYKKQNLGPALSKHFRKT